MDTRQHDSLDGQQYLVLRPTADVAREYERTQARLLEGPGRGLKHPLTGHVTLRGFHEPERRAELASLIRGWAAAQHPIEVIAEAVDAFPAPWQIIIVRLVRTPALVDAYASLTAALSATDIHRLDELDVDDWIFHLSVVYARALDAEAWSGLETAARRDLSPVGEVISDAEFIWYDNGVEHSEIIPLGGTPCG